MQKRGEMLLGIANGAMRAVRALAVAGAAFGVACLGPATADAGNRAYELVSPPEKNGGEVTGNATRTRVAADGNAVMFTSLSAFGDAAGTGVATEYMAERARAASPGTNGWETHAITPSQESQVLFADAFNLEPGYQGMFSDDLSKGVYRAWAPLTDAPSVADAVNLYVRKDLRVQGRGSYELATGCPVCVVPLPAPFRTNAPAFAGASRDFSHVIFEDAMALTTNASASITNKKLYESKGGSVQLVGVLPGGQAAVRSGAGYGASIGTSNLLSYVDRPISADGTRVVFTVGPSNSVFTGAVYMRVNGTATVQLNASERSSPAAAQLARYWTASSDESRVFFTSDEPLTDAAPTDGTKLYMWEKQKTSETQALTIDATGGTFTLEMDVQPATATATLTSGSATVKSVAVKSGAFSVGQAISGPGISPGTTIVAMGDFSSNSQSTLTLSAPATASGSGQAIDAIVNATTAPLAFDASAEQIKTALEALPPIGSGNVTVSKGPGPSDPYDITFTGDLAGVDVTQLRADPALLTGGAATAAISTTHAVKNLSYLNVDHNMADATNIAEGVIGASEDGSYVYFVAIGQLVADAPPLDLGYGIYLWHDGTVAYVGESARFGADSASMLDGAAASLRLKQARVTPDGRHLLFQTQSGDGLMTAHGGTDYQHNNFPQLYVYSADTNQLACASCKTDRTPATADSVAFGRWTAGASLATNSLNRPISGDGRHVFFSTAQALVPEDVNDKIDAYEYDVATGTQHLLSSGTDPSNSYFMGASASGDDAFFITRQQLVGWDRDQGYDLYDARVGGGFPEPTTTGGGCAGDACQGVPSAAPGAAAAGSASFRGSGNARSLRRAAKRRRRHGCRRGYVRKRVHGRTGHVRKGHGKRLGAQKRARGRLRCVKKKHRARPAARRRDVARHRRAK